MLVFFKLGEAKEVIQKGGSQFIYINFIPASVLLPIEVVARIGSHFVPQFLIIGNKNPIIIKIIAQLPSLIIAYL
jgi:hypothetical protein